MSEKFCPNCGKKLPADAKFCLYCGASIKEISVEKAKSGLVTAGGILVILAACICAIQAFISYIATVIGFVYYPGTIMDFYLEIYYVVAFFGLIGFGLGLTAAIQSLRRKSFTLAIFGIVFLMFAGFLDFLIIIIPYGGFEFGIAFGMPIIAFSLLGLIFVATRKVEFS